VDLPEDEERSARELEVLSRPVENAAQRAARLEAFARVLAEPSGPNDPRIQWLGQEARKWLKRDEKTLIFVSRRESLTFLKKELEYHTSRRIAVFHEDLSPAQRDLEVARFADADGPGILIATESGGEGRNFQFARRLVMFDLPWNPVLVEQRIGRLDRINRRIPVEILYFRPAGGFAAEVARLYEALGIFEAPLGGLERALGHVVEAIHEALDGAGGNLDVNAIVTETHEARARVAQAVYHHLHAERYDASLAEGILARVPGQLEKLTAGVVLEAGRLFGFEIEPKPGKDVWYLEYGSEATVEALHGVPAGSRFLGTFDRGQAVRREALDFFASGHPLVEGILGEYADGTGGQVALFEIPDSGHSAVGVLLASKDGARIHWTFVDLAGRERPELPAVILGARAFQEIPATRWVVPEWTERVRALATDTDLPGQLTAAAGVLLSR
jgi:ATP-dependent helicase HepA